MAKAKRGLRDLRDMVDHDVAGGLLLVGFAVLALVAANTPLSSLYHVFLDTPVHVKFGTFKIEKPLLLWINDGLMAMFFFLVGLEIKREVFLGHLKSFDQVVLPGVGAIAGIAAPALIYAYLTKSDPVALHGWAVPSATDIAFALGVFSIFGRSLPMSLKLFLLSVAIFDDIGAIIIIALFYSHDLSTLSLAVAGSGLVLLFVFNRLHVRSFAAYMLVGIIVWGAVLKSGVHATLAGFILAWFIPLSQKTDHGEVMLEAAEHALQPWVAFFIVPLFAFANAGVSLNGFGFHDLLHPVTLGITLGLFLGKQIGIFGICWIVIKLGWAKLPAQATWLQLYGVSVLCGIGFTMSLFVGSLAFELHGDDYNDHLKIGVLFGSFLSAVVGATILRFGKRQIIAAQKEEAQL